MYAFNVLGDMLDNSGWTGALTQANVASYNTAVFFLKMSGTRQAHQVTASSFHVLIHKANNGHCSSQYENQKCLEDWCDESQSQSTVSLLVNLSAIGTPGDTLLRSLMEADFKLYIDSLLQLVPLFFSLDHSLYPRWAPVHLRDMVTLAENHPVVFLIRCSCMGIPRTGRIL